jgi:hypothetical protein
MLFSLVVIAMLIRYAANSDNWRWVDTLDGDAWNAIQDPPDKPTPHKPAPKKPRAAAVAAKPEAQPQPTDSAKADEPAELTDLDPEEADSAREELQAVGDRTLFNQPEEMLAYNRLVKWTRNQSFEALLKRAKRKVFYNDFVQSPDKWRGKLVALDLTAARIIKYDQKPGDNPLYTNLYEVWGFTNESRNWFYEFVAVDPPKDLPTGPSLWEKVRVVGYFFKVQAYQPAGAKLNDPPLFAPMFIGRLSWTPPVIPQVQSADYLWAGMVALLFGLIMAAAMGAAFLTRRRRARPQVSPVGTSGLTTDEWLDRAMMGEAPGDDLPADNPLGGGDGRQDASRQPLDPQDNPTSGGPEPRNDDRD